MVHQIIKPTFIFVFLAFFFSGCYYDNNDSVYPYYEANCDTSNVSYSLNINPVLIDRCVSCHNANNPSAGVLLDTYNGVKTVADNGRLWGSINHENGYSAMPQDGNKLNSCSLGQIEAWINSGSPDN